MIAGKFKITNSNTKELLKGSFVALLFKAFGIVIGLVFTLFLTHLYGAEKFGIYVTFWSLLMILSVVAKLGFDTSIVKFIAGFNKKNEVKNIKTVYTKALKFISVLSLIIGLVLFVLSDKVSLLFYDTTDYKNIIQILSAALLFYSVLTYNAESLKGLKKVLSFSALQNGTVFFMALLIIYFLKNEKAEEIVYSVTAAIMLLLPISFFIFYKSLKNKNKLEDKSTEFPYSNKEIFNISLPMLLGNSMLLMMSWTDSLMLSAMGPERDVGIYNTAMRISALLPAILISINSIAMPKFAELIENENKKELRKFVKRSTLMIFSLSSPILLAILIFPETILSIFGEEFIEGKSALIILGIGYFFSAISGATIHLLNMTSLEKTAKNILIFSAVLNIILNLILIPLYGIIGAAIASTATNVLLNAVAVYIIYKKHGFLTYPIGP